MLNYDVIIVGGGPAGASAGLHLAQQGLRVAILEKETLPRFKPCGGGLTYRILKRFPHLQNAIEPLVLNRPHRLQFYSPALACLEYAYNEPLTLMIRRSEFDAMLIEQCRQAGAAVLTATRAAQVRVTPQQVEVVTGEGATLRAQALVGADGANSLIATQVGLRAKWRRDQYVVSLVAELPDAEVKWADHATIQLCYGIDNLGYGWVFPKQQVVNLGILGFAGQASKTNLQAVYAQFLQILKTQGKIAPTLDATHLRGGIIPIKGVIPKTQTDRVLLCGDAAGFVHGVTGEGIYYALVSGELAAQTLVQAFRRNDFREAALTPYQTAWQTEIGEELSQAVHVQQRLLANLHWIDVLVRMIAKREGLQKMFTDYFMGKMTYNALKHDLLRRFLPQYLKLQIMKLFRT